MNPDRRIELGSLKFNKREPTNLVGGKKKNTRKNGGMQVGKDQDNIRGKLKGEKDE